MTIYLDNAATTRLADEVRAAMLPFFGERVGNPSSVHQLGVAADRSLRQAHQTVAAALGAEGSQLVFTSGGTEANALAILGTTSRRRRRPGHLVCSAIEHASVLDTCRTLVQDEGWTLTEVPVDRCGLVDPAAVADALRPDTALVSIGLANNVFGTVQPLREILRAVRAKDARVPVHADAVQAFLKEPLDLRRLPLSLVTVSSHKLHGPPGVGALYVAPGVHLQPLWRGGQQEGGRRAGTENLPGAVGFAAAVERTLATRAEDLARMCALRDRLIAGLLDAVPGSRLNGHPTRRLPHNAHLSLPGVRSEPLLHALDVRGVTASVGSACHATERSLDQALRAIGYRDDERWGHLRLTLSRETTAAEIEQTVAIVREAHQEAARGMTGDPPR